MIRRPPRRGRWWGAVMAKVTVPAVLAACGVSFVGVRAARAQFFSPGPLARPHASLEGLEKCSKCHAEQKGLSAKLCLDCHTELAGRVAKGSGFHGRLPAAKKEACQGCHPDHRGVDFKMVEWEPSRDKFDHQKTGWALKGGHAKVKCADCHDKRLLADGAIRRMLDKQPKRETYLGLATRCESCHFDEHRGQLGRECQKCHNEVEWKKAPSFNHQETAFALRGKHQKVDCAKCHPNQNDDKFAASAFPKPRAASFMLMKPVEHKTCESCHQDPHKGSLGPNCASCHQEEGWKLIKTSKNQNTSFHDKTRFPLRGGHVGVACRSCHGPFPGQPAKFKGLAFGACSDCHEDAHLGQLAGKGVNAGNAGKAGKAGKAGDSGGAPPCDSCHTVAAFSPPRYELEQHAKTKFPLEGGHAAVACRACHPSEPSLAGRIPAAVRRRLSQRKRPETFSFVVFHPKAAAEGCAGCHADVHRGQFAANKTKNTCESCHKTTSFADLAFDHDKDSRFPLSGKHAQTPCAGCHKPEKVANGGKSDKAGVPATLATMVRYKPLDVACGSCHADYHQGQFRAPRPADTMSDGNARRAPKVRDCDFCHGTKTFKETSFDHNDPALHHVRARRQARRPGVRPLPPHGDAAG